MPLEVGFEEDYIEVGVAGTSWQALYLLRQQKGWQTLAGRLGRQQPNINLLSCVKNGF